MFGYDHVNVPPCAWIDTTTPPGNANVCSYTAVGSVTGVVPALIVQSGESDPSVNPNRVSFVVAPITDVPAMTRSSAGFRTRIVRVRAITVEPRSRR